jgi:hypothetical protein
MKRETALGPALVVCWALSLSGAPSGDPADGLRQEAGAGAPKQAAGGGGAQQAAGTAPKKRDLGAWWQKNAMEYSPLPERWLFHADGTLSYMNASGNTSGSTFDVGANAQIRKDRVTSNSFVQLTRRNMVYGFSQGSVDYVERMLREQVDIAVAARIKVVAGIEGYRNTLMFMDKRVNVYGGLGATILRDEKRQATFTAGIGHATFAFDRAQMLSVNPSQVKLLDTDPASGGALAMQTWRWNVTNYFSFTEDASYMKYFDAHLGYRWTVNLGGSVPINKHLSFTVSYRLKEEANDIIRALRVVPRDRGLVMGIRASI